MTQREYSAGISDCHYAVRRSAMDTAFGSLPGAIKLTRRPSTEGRSLLVRNTEGRVYNYTSAQRESERRYTLEIVSLTREFLTDVLGYIENEDGSLSEGIADDVHFSLFYQTENGGRPVRYQIYDCVVSPPSFDAQTLSSNLSADIRKLELTASPDPLNDHHYGIQIAREDNAELYDSWFGMSN